MARPAHTIRFIAAEYIFQGATFEKVITKGGNTEYRALWGNKEYAHKNLTDLCQELWDAARGKPLCSPTETSAEPSPE